MTPRARGVYGPRNVMKRAALRSFAVVFGASLALGGCLGGDDFDQSVEGITVCGSGSTVEGIDVSYWQGTIDWVQVRAAGKRFAIARVAHATALDSTFARNWAGMRANGILRGAYLYFEPNSDPVAQADIVVRAVGRLGQGDLPVTLDVERPPPNLPSPATYAARIRQFVDRVQAGTGKAPMIYTGAYYWPPYVGSTAFRTNPLWHAQYTSARCPNIAAQWSDWTFWQYTSTGSVRGISGNVDLDRFNGTLAELQRLAGVTTAPIDAGVRDAGPRDTGVRDVTTDVARDVARDVSADVARDVSRDVSTDVARDVATRDVVDDDVAPDAAVDDVPSPDDAATDDAAAVDEAILDDDAQVTEDGPDLHAGETDAGEVVAMEPGGCGCRTGNPSRGMSPWAMVGFAALAAARVRRRNRG